MKRPPWGHVSRHCVICGKVGPRVLYQGGYAHRYCINRQKPSLINRPAPTQFLHDANAAQTVLDDTGQITGVAQW